VRDLGISWDLQRDLFRGVLDRLTAFDQRMADEARRQETLRDHREQALAATLAPLEKFAPLEKLASEQQAALAAVEKELAPLAARLCDVLGAVEELRTDLRTLRDRQDALRVRQASLEDDLAGAYRVTVPPTGVATQDPLEPRLASEDFAQLLARVDRPLGGGEPAAAVEVSIQDARAEDLLAVAHRRFRARLSAAADPYRAPNDLWVHVDFTMHWDRPLLLDNAAARLRGGGRLALITVPGAGAPPARVQLRPEEDAELTLPSGVVVRLLVWERL
jgi:hypothetical protein